MSNNSQDILLVLSLFSFVVYLIWSFYFFRKDVPYLFKPDFNVPKISYEKIPPLDIEKIKEDLKEVVSKRGIESEEIETYIKKLKADILITQKKVEIASSYLGKDPETIRTDVKLRKINIKKHAPMEEFNLKANELAEQITWYESGQKTESDLNRMQ
jgi:hypothetical protein